MAVRMEPAAAEDLRRAIHQAGGVEVFAIGDVRDGHIVSVTVSCRGTPDQVPALIDRPRAGQAVIHNHPSGDLRPSGADLRLASMYGEDGVGVVIVNSGVTQDNWVVEPHAPQARPVDDARLERFFTEGLAAALPGWEPRPQQLEMARRVAESLQDDRPLLCEAGTGTGKSLAYLVPAALWALANETKVVVSTYTLALQAQLLTADLPALARGGLHEVRAAVLQGRNNYLCRRRLALARSEDPKGEEADTLTALDAWSETTTVGARSDLGVSVEPALWDRVMSDGDLTLSVRCPHYRACHYYSARRDAAAAHVIVVNHALLLTDLAMRADVGRGFLPRYDRVVIDEAHHIEDAATGVATERLSALAIRRAASGLIDTRRHRGALSRLVAQHGGPESALPAADRPMLSALAATASTAAERIATGARNSLVQVADAVLDGAAPVRITPEVEVTDAYRLDLVPTVRHLTGELEATTEALDAVEALFSDVTVPEGQAQPLLDVRRARRRLQRHSDIARSFLDGGTDCRWVETARDREQPPAAAICAAPAEVAPVLKQVLWDVLGGVVSTSATLTVAGRFGHWIQRAGLDAPMHREVVFPSPFDHAAQAILALPRDLPTPDDPRFMAETSALVTEAVALSDGGAFVLCTSYTAVRAYAKVLRAAGGRPVLAQGEAGRGVLLQRFKDNRRSVLVGTDSFWEGVSVRGDGLRLVVIPRLPFRVPTEPLQQARQERISARGGDPFRTFTLPQAILKLRQGYGRLIRSHTDTGVVLLLDRRVHERRYGQIVLRSLPPARRVTGPWRVVREAVKRRLADHP